MFRPAPVLLMAAAFAAPASATVIELDFVGNAGAGLLPGNEVGANTPVAPNAAASNAVGFEAGRGLTYNDQTNVFEFEFNFFGLTGGLFDAASGIHFHNTGDVPDPLNANGGIVLNLNTGADPAVALNSPLIAFGATSGQVSGSALLSEELEADLLAGRFYLNIHTDGFRGGELRANVAAVPEPATAGLLLAGVAGLIARRRKI